MKISFAIFCSFITFSHSFGWKPYKSLIIEFKEDPYNQSIELLDSLGEGSFGEVWKGIEKSSRREVAVKLEKKTDYVSYSYLFFPIYLLMTKILVQGVPKYSSTVSTITNSTSTNFSTKVLKFVLVEFFSNKIRTS